MGFCGNFLKTASSCRWILSYCVCLGMLFVYGLRINLSVAIVCMVRPPSRPNSTSNSSNDGCGKLEQKDPTTSGEFDWDKQTQGIILSSFFFGYIVTQIPGGWLERRFGGKSVHGFGMFITIVATMLLPGFARIHVGLVIMLRVIMGLGTGVSFPAIQGMWGHWAPPLERSKLIAFGAAGTMLGNVITFSLSGVLCATKVEGGWPLIFYVFGGGATLWLILWFFLAYSTPDDNSRISEEERVYINDSIGISDTKEDIPPPWAAMFKSPAVWAIIIAHVCNNWGNYTLLTSLPSYMRDVLKFDISQNGALSALPYIVMFVTANIAGHLADFIRARGMLGTTAVRKLFQTMGLIVPAAFMTGVGFVDCHNRALAVTLMTLAVAFTAGNRVGYNVNHVDIAPRFSGILFGISNTLATLPGIFAPLAVGAITKDGTRQQWQIVFGICAVFYVIGAICYLILGSGEEQPWNKGTSLPYSKELEMKVAENVVVPHSGERKDVEHFTKSTISS